MSAIGLPGAVVPQGLARGLRWVVGLPARGAVALVRGYQILLSPLTPPSCKYYPCCSSYSVTALRRFGLVRGVTLTAWRLARCNPWSHGGVDDVPVTFRLRAAATETSVPTGTPERGVERPASDRSTPTR